MSEFIEQMLDAISAAGREPEHTLVVKMSYSAHSRMRIEADLSWLTGRTFGYEIAGCPILIDPTLGDETWELLSVQPATLYARRKGAL